ncbi:MAG: tetratricopeptide repeat protein [bacterium]|nr:tetratricopeptide repeat protein [bacterium]
MKLFERLTSWLKSDPPSSLTPELEDLRDAIERGRRLKRHEKYDDALLVFDEGAVLARQLYDVGASVAISLHRADTFTRMGRYEEAAALLSEMQATARDGNQRNHLAYIHTAQGMLAQAQDDWTTARAYYEQALQLAQEARSPGAEGRAQGHLADTYLHDGNASYATHLMREALPKLNVGGDLELSSYFVGRLGEALVIIGQENEGRNLLGRALRLAEHMEYRAYERQWRIALAGQAMALSRYDEARRLFEDALTITDTTKPTPQAVMLLCQLSKCLLRLLEYDAALQTAQKAVALCEGLDEADERTVQARGALGIALRSMERNADALSLLQSAARHYNRLKTTEADHSEIEVLRNLAAAQAETHDSDTAFATYQQALEKARSQGVRLEVAGTYRDIGILQARLGQTQEAIRTWSQALDIYEAERQFGRVARLYCDIANLRRSLGFGKRAMQDYEKALMALNSVDDPETRGVVLSNAATAYVDQGDIETAESFFVESIRLAQKIQDRPAEATRRGNYGWFLLSTGRAQRALGALDYAQRQSQEMGLALPYAVQTDNIGLAYDELGQPEEALAHHQQALALMESLNSPRWESVIRANIGQSLLALSRAEDAVPYFENALAAARAGDDSEVSARALTGQGRIALQQGDSTRAGQAIAEAVFQARRSGSRRLLADALALQSEQQAQSGQQAESAASWDEAKRLYALLNLPASESSPAWLNGQNGALPGNEND